MKLWEKVLVAVMACVLVALVVLGVRLDYERTAQHELAKAELLQAHGKIASLQNARDSAVRDFNEKNDEYTAAVKGWTESLEDANDRAAMWLDYYNQARGQLPPGWGPKENRWQKKLEGTAFSDAQPSDDFNAAK